MLSKLGNMLGRKPVKPVPQAVSLPSTPARATSASPARRRNDSDPRQTYARVFRWRVQGDCIEMPVSVEVIGSFTRWQSVSLAHNLADNSWSATISSIPGNRTHHYMLLINGKPTFDSSCDGFALPHGFDEEQYALMTDRGPRVLMLFAHAK
jgi:hypothetical protein